MTMHHGTMFNAADPLGTVVVLAGIVLTATAFVLAIRWTFAPGEQDPDHPKRIVLREDR